MIPVQMPTYNSFNHGFSGSANGLRFPSKSSTLRGREASTCGRGRAPLFALPGANGGNTRGSRGSHGPLFGYQDWPGLGRQHV